MWVEFMRWKWPTFPFDSRRTCWCAVSCSCALPQQHPKKRRRRRKCENVCFLLLTFCNRNFKSISNMVRVAAGESRMCLYLSRFIQSRARKHTAFHHWPQFALAETLLLLMCLWRRREEKNSHLKFRCNYSARSRFWGASEPLQFSAHAKLSLE